MSGRKTALQIPSIARATLGGDLAGTARMLSGYSPIHGRMVRVTLAGAGAQNFRHGLGRRFVGVYYAGGGNTSITFGIADPELVESIPLDASVWFRVNPSGATTASYNFWVF